MLSISFRPDKAMDMYTFLLTLSLLSSAFGGGLYPPSATSCQPRTEQITLTRTTVEPLLEQATTLDLQHEHQDVKVTSFVVERPTYTQTLQLTLTPDPSILTQVSLLTSTAFHTKLAVARTTTVLTETVQLLASEVAVEDRTLTQTAIQLDTKTLTLTRLSLETAFSTLSVTDTQLALVTETELAPHFVTQTTRQTFAVWETQTVTSYKDVPLEKTVTVTEREYVTKCYQPRITYAKDNTMARISTLSMLVLAQVAAGLYYENFPLVCPLKQDVQYEDKVIQATYLEVQLLETQVPLTLTQIETVTRRLSETVLDVATRTATNYHTLVETVAVLQTHFDTVTEVQTRLLDVTLTVHETQFSTLTWTLSQLETQQLVESVKETSVTTTTEYVPRYTTNTHTLTKMVTQTVCPPSAQHSLKW
ncbi:hypothetical protein C7M84_009235 [Penaeus vannamei]|uniref:Zonadhesin n=1 Tax=Penaeus vannamei TaxID=6689 RepID=A0A3R7M450_PENVA|nr:hypothetical protein C7M84_009235 [Penaeus vannamei]